MFKEGKKIKSLTKQLSLITIILNKILLTSSKLQITNNTKFFFFSFRMRTSEVILENLKN
jgi:hypothetical protein